MFPCVCFFVWWGGGGVSVCVVLILVSMRSLFSVRCCYVLNVLPVSLLFQYYMRLESSLCFFVVVVCNCISLYVLI